MARNTESEFSGGGNFMKILDGSIVSRAEEALDDRYELFQTKNPKTDEPVEYYIKRYKGGVEGMITGLERVELKGVNIFGYNLHMEDEDGKFSIYFADDRATTDRLLKVFEAIDLDEEVLINVWKDKEGHNAIIFKQNGNNVSAKWNKDNLPDPLEIKGKWNYDNVSNFLYENARDKILPAFADQFTKDDEGEEVPTHSGEPEAKAKGKKAKAATADTDDLPF